MQFKRTGEEHHSASIPAPARPPCLGYRHASAPHARHVTAPTIHTLSHCAPPSRVLTRPRAPRAQTCTMRKHEALDTSMHAPRHTHPNTHPIAHKPQPYHNPEPRGLSLTVQPILLTTPHVHAYPNQPGPGPAVTRLVSTHAPHTPCVSHHPRAPLVPP